MCIYIKLVLNSHSQYKFWRSVGIHSPVQLSLLWWAYGGSIRLHNLYYKLILENMFGGKTCEQDDTNSLIQLNRKKSKFLSLLVL